MMAHHSRQTMPPADAQITMLRAEREALRRRVAELEAELAKAATATLTEVKGHDVPSRKALTAGN